MFSAALVHRGDIALHSGSTAVMAPLGCVVAVVGRSSRGRSSFVPRPLLVIITIGCCCRSWRRTGARCPGLQRHHLELPVWDPDFQNSPLLLFLRWLVLTGFHAWIAAQVRTGLIAIREDEGKAASIGVNTTIFKIMAYGASAFFIGVAGGVYAYFQTFLNPVGSFAILGSVLIVLSALLGGRGTLYGPVIGAFIVQLVNEGATVYGGGSSTPS